jgi:hypothetical protein
MISLYMIITEIFFFVFCILALIPTLKNWRETRNQMFVAILLYIIALLCYSLFNIVVYSINFNLDIILGAALTIGNILGLILFTIQLEFLFYLKHLVKLYTLPLVGTFYIFMGKLMVDSSIPFILYAILVSSIPAYLLMRDGKNKQNGLAFGMGIFFLLWTIGQVIQMDLVFQLFKIIGMFTFYLGTKGFYEKYVFHNPVEQQKIMNTWISKIVIKAD